MTIRVNGPGFIINFPDGTDQETMNRAMREAYAKRQGAQPAPQPTVAAAPPSATEPASPPQPDESFGRGLELGTQKVGSGLANLAGAPVDIMTLVLNSLSGLTNLTGNAVESAAGLAGKDVNIPDIPRITNPIGGAENIKDIFSKMFEAVGGHVYTPEEMTPQQQLVGNLVDFGTQGAAGGAGLVKSAAVKSAEAAPTIANTLAKSIPAYLTNAYKTNPGRMLVGDTAGGIGSGAALEAGDEYLPDWLATNPLVRFTLAALGGGAGATTAGVATDLPKMGTAAVTDRLPAPAVFQDPNSIVPVSNRSANQAIDFVHRNVTDAKSALGQLFENLNFFNEAGGAKPTTGLMTDDTGLQMIERQARDANPRPYAESDTAVRNSAFNDVSNLKPEGANQALPRQVAENEIAVRQGSANARLANAEQQVARQNKSDLALGDVYAQPPMNAEEASTALDKALIQGTGIPMRAQKKANYEAVDPTGEVKIGTEDLVSLAKDLDQLAKTLPPSLRDAPESLISDIKAYEPKIDPKTGENVGGPGEVSFKELNDWRPRLSELENRARKEGQVGLADAYMRIRKQIGAEVDALAESGTPAGEAAKEANRFYKQDYEPFRTGVVGERMKDVARNPQRDMTPPSETASKLIVKGPGAPEAGANVNAAISRGTPEAQAASHEAIKNYFLADLRNTVRDGKVSETRLASWIKNNESTLDQYPDFKKEVTDLLSNVRGRGQKTSALEAELKAATASKAQTEKDLAKSGFAIFAGKDPEKAVSALFSADDPVSAVRRMRKSFAGNKEADAGLKAMVADHIVDQVKLASKAGVSGGADPISLAKVDSLFKRNERLLNEVYGDDMRYLRQARRRLEALSKRSVAANPGSTSIERSGIDRLSQMALRPAEIVAKLVFGQLKGGGYTRSARLMAESMPDSTSAARDLIYRMSFDPELAKYILSATPKEVAGPGWSKRLNRMMGWAEAGRQSGKNEGTP